MSAWATLPQQSHGFTLSAARAGADQRQYRVLQRILAFPGTTSLLPNGASGFSIESKEVPARRRSDSKCLEGDHRGRRKHIRRNLQIPPSCGEGPLGVE